jgi:tetratricopeptide (TPR) repeat protein
LNTSNTAKATVNKTVRAKIVHVLVLAGLSLIANATAAQTAAAPSSADVNEARLHFERGVELYREGSLDAALAEFQRSNQLAPNYKLLYNLAQVQAERHEYVAAVKLLTEYLRTGAADVSADRKRAVGDDIDKLRQRISSLEVQVSVDGAEVFVNDAPVGRSPLPEAVLVNVGTCRVRAEKTGFVTKQQSITVVGADRQRVELKLVAGPAVAQRGAQTTTIKTSNMTPFWISLGATVVLGGTTAVMGGLTLNANNDLDQALNELPAQHDKVDSARHKVRTMAALTDGFGAASIVAAGSALYFLIAPPEQTEVVRASGVQARVQPTPTGVAVSGMF